MSTPPEPKLNLTIPPLPTTRRGYGIQLNILPKDERLLYCNGRVVVLRSLTHPSDCLLFTEHKANVTVATPSPSQTWVASGDDEGNVLIWAYPSLKLKAQYKVGKSITDIDWDESSTRLICAGDGAQKAKVISYDSGNSLGEISMHNLPIISCSYRKQRPFRVATASEDLTVNLYEGPPFKYKESHRRHARYPNVVRYSPDGNLLISAGADSKLVVYDGKTGEVVREVDEGVEGGHKAAIYALAWSPDSKQVVTAAGNRQCKVWDVAEGKVITTITFGSAIDDMQVGVAWSKGHLISVSLSGAINYLDLSSPTPIRTLHGHQTTIQSMALHPAGSAFYTAGLTGEVTRWTAEGGEGQWLSGKGHGGKVVSALTLSATHLHSFGLDDCMRVTDLTQGELSGDGVPLGGLPVAAVTTQAGLSVAVLAQEKAVLLTPQRVEATIPLGYVPTAVALSRDEKIVAVGGKDKKVYLYTLGSSPASLTLLHTLTTHDKPVTSMSFSPANTHLVSVDREASVYIHALEGYGLMNKSGWRFHQAGVMGVEWGPGGQWVVTVGLDHAVIVWGDVEGFDGGKRAKIASAHSAGVDGVHWWDANTFLTYGSDRTIKRWTL